MVLSVKDVLNLLLILLRSKDMTMGLFDWLFGKKTKYSQKDIQLVSAGAQRYVDVINESLAIANKSKNPETKLSRLSVAKSKLEELKELTEQYEFIHLTQLDEVSQSIKELELEFLTTNLQEVASGNLEAEALEKEGKVEEAIGIYRELANKGTDTPFTYRRLAILYRRQKKQSEEIEVIEQALRNVSKSNGEWFEERLHKIKLKVQSQ